MALFIPFALVIARMVATQVVKRAALKAAPSLAPGVARAGASLSVPIVNKLPVVGRAFSNLSRQPRVLGMKPVTPAPTRLGRVGQSINPRRITSPLWTQKMPLAAPKPMPGVPGVNVTARAMGTGEKLARTFVGAPIKGVASLTSPFAFARAGEFTYYSNELGKRNQRRAAEQASAPSFDPINYQGPEDITPAPARPTPPGGGATTPAIPPSITPSPDGRSGTDYPFSPNYVPPQGAIDRDQANRDELNRNLSAISSSYNSAVSEIKRLYNLSETEEEKELLRFQLADLEAQLDAGQKAVRNLYSEKTANLQLMTQQSRAEGTQSAEAMGQLYNQSATDLEALQEARRSAQVERNRGLGIGAVGLEGDYSNLLRTMAPIAQSSAQTISDIGSQGLEFLSGLSQSMGAAREGELQSLGAARNASIREMYMQQVLDRINQERMQMNQQVGSLIASRASAVSSAIGNFRNQGGDPTFADMYDQLNFFAQDGIPPQEVGAMFGRFFPGVQLTPELMRQYSQWYEAFATDRDLGLRASTGDADAAESRARQEAIQELMLRGYTRDQAAAAIGNSPGGR
jgi:hypothetical protein